MCETVCQLLVFKRIFKDSIIIFIKLFLILHCVKLVTIENKKVHPISEFGDAGKSRWTNS